MASGRSIRFKISTLLVIPLISLVALWGFAASTTAREALNLLKVETFWTGVIDRTDYLVVQLQQERLASAELIAGSVSDTGALAAARRKVDEARKTLTVRALSPDVQSVLSPDMKTQLTAAFKEIDRLSQIRRQVDTRALTAHALITEYAVIPDAIDRLYAAFTVSTDAELSRQAQGLIAAQQVRELLSREHALIVAGNAAGGADRWSMAEVHMLAGIDGARTYLFPKAMANFDAELRAPLEQLAQSPRYTTMERALQGYVGGQPVDMELWRGTVEPVLKDYTQGLYTTGDILLARMEPAGMIVLVRATVAGALGLIAVIASIVISIRVARRISRELMTLRGSARELAEVRLPEVVAKLSQGERVDIAVEAPPLTVKPGSTSEIADLATAFESVQHTAVDAAVEQARLREGVSQALRNLARRSQSLVQRQLKLLDEMQRQTEEPEALAGLFKLDHLTTRMRRHAEGLVLLSGGAVGRRWGGVIPMEDVLSGAAAQVEDYTRVRVYPMPECGIVGSAVADLMHLFAELIENAAAFSSPGNEVSVRGELVGKGFAVEIEDRGLGMSQTDRDAINRRLAGPPEFDLTQSERLGFSVVGMLAARHGVAVTIKPSPYGGTTAIVLVPAALVQPTPQTPPAPPPRDMPELEPVSVSMVSDETGPGELPRRIRTARRGAEPQGSGLPRRVRQANLPEQLKERQEPLPEALRERSPEEARALLSSLQSGWQRGRQDGDQDGGSRP